LSDSDPMAPPERVRGPYYAKRVENLAKARAAGAKQRAEKRASEPRTATPRTAATAAPVARAPEAQSSRMPRDSGLFSPEYDGPTARPSRDERDVNKFEPPAKTLKKLKLSGWDVAWKVTTIFNQPVDGVELLEATNAGWRPAKAKDFPELVPTGTDPNGTVDRFGQRLYIRPAAMTRQAIADDYNRANEVMKSRMAANQEGARIGSSGDTDDPALSDMGRIVRPVAISLEVEGEMGTHGAR
jgi:hypothetical protein